MPPAYFVYTDAPSDSCLSSPLVMCGGVKCNTTVWLAVWLGMLTLVAIYTTTSSSIFWDERSDMRTDRASAILFHVETQPSRNADVFCVGETVVNFDSAWQRMPTGSGVVSDTAVNVSAFTLPTRAIYSFDVHLYQDDSENTGASTVPTDTGYIYLRIADGGEPLAYAPWEQFVPSSYNRDGSATLHVTRLLPAGTVVELRTVCYEVNFRILQGSFSIRMESIADGAHLPAPTPAPTSGE